MPPKRKRTNDDENQDENESKRYAHLKPQVRRVPEKTIKAKWSTLPEPVQEKVRELFHSLERPVIVRNKNEQKRIEAQSAVQAVVRNLGKRLPRMPFPPITKDSNFDYESALNEHRSLEANLATINDSIELLKSEIAKEEEHPVLQQLDDLPPVRDAQSSEFTLADTKTSHVSLNELDDDPEVQGLMKQLHGHLQSMQSNTAPLAGLRDAITRSQAALDLYSND
ncbi:hypothetical protein N7532_000722 [Penicillium argentinense]|uniref:Kinetochore protein fta7 n=1 Tax=Penicillium argentinense TaxID=1131581 RepID=A0A9W9G630_9EURO|nr:uncharacterized protein N7532_000722 [Penicillium argentinense]KAJ5112677.1 hypothetical protein N7532_000722 [Penicillium argentinense]